MVVKKKLVRQQDLTGFGPWIRREREKLDIPLKANLAGIVDGQILFSTDVEWKAGNQTFPADSIVSADLAAFKANPNGAARGGLRK